MKNLTILLLSIFATANIYSQTYIINFAATGAATTVDSVKVENLTHPATVSWHSGDVLHLVLGNGINETSLNNENLQVFPNPMQGQAEISFYAKQSANATINIYDIAGKTVLQTEDKLLQGAQKYQLAGLKQGVYFINISGDSYFYTAKLISQNATPGEAKIKYITSEKPEAVVTTLKNTKTKATITMSYTTGDNIRFTGYAGSLTAIVEDVPTGSKTITFAFVTPGVCGSQVFTTVNINTGTMVTQATTQTLGTKWCYNNLPANCDTYGGLYQWNTAMNGDTSTNCDPCGNSGAQGICPAGYHIPTDLEWSRYEYCIESSITPIGTTSLATFQNTDGFRGTITGTKMKASTWDGTNTSGFSGLPGGYSYGGNSSALGMYTHFWSATEYAATNAWYRYLNTGYDRSLRGGVNKPSGFSVRCIQN